MTGTERTEPLDAAPTAVEPGATEQPVALDLDAVYRRHAPDVARWIQRLSPSDETADALHDVFLVVERRLAGFRGEASVRTWLYAITVRVVVARRRKQRLRRLFFGESTEVSEPAAPETPHSSFEAKRASEAVYRTLDKLGERDRALLVLFEIEGLEASEISAVLGLKPNGVWVALHRARERFRRAFIALHGDREGER